MWGGRIGQVEYVLLADGVGNSAYYTRPALEARGLPTQLVYPAPRNRTGHDDDTRLLDRAEYLARRMVEDARDDA